jgi:hypothetical protein
MSAEMNGVQTVGGLQHFEAGTREIVSHQLHEIRFVIHHENFGAHVRNVPDLHGCCAAIRSQSGDFPANCADLSAVSALASSLLFCR